MKNLNRILFLLVSVGFGILSFGQEQKMQDNTVEAKSNPCGNPCLSNVPLFERAYSGSYIIGDNQRYQSVYSSQNYGTFYEVYMKANFIDESIDALVTSFEFILVNFRGPLNLGFATDGKAVSEMHYNDEDSVIGMKIIVRGKNSKNHMKFEVPSTWGIKRNNVEQINIFRVLIPMDGTLISLMVKNQIFDSEFYERNGIGLTRKKIVPPGHYDFDNPGVFGPKIEEISQRDFFNDLLKINSSLYPKEFDISPQSKDSNCYTSTMYVQ